MCVMFPDMGTSVYISETSRTLSQAGAEVMRSCQLPKGSVMMSCIATIGKCGITTKDSFTNQQINSVICDHNKVHPLYLYCVFTQLGFELDAAGGGGSVYTNVSKSRFSDISVIILHFSEQRAIAHILGSLDDKIELNRRMNQTLEATARAIFKSWFVDFDPVRVRRGESRFALNLPPEILNFFPDSFQNSEFGEIPKGWEVKTIGQAVKCVGGSTPSTKNSAFWDGGKNPFVTPKDMSSLTSPVILDTSRHITDAGVEKISSGRLPIRTVILSKNQTLSHPSAIPCFQKSFPASCAFQMQRSSLRRPGYEI
jgi:type I restriction enzyme S subunit